jgi:hypothetical protein
MNGQRWRAGLLLASLLLALTGCRAAEGATRPDADATSAASAVAGVSGRPTPVGGGCLTGHVELQYRPEDPANGILCVRPFTELTLVLLPRQGQRWVALHSNNPSHARPQDWSAGRDGTAEVTVHCGPHGHAKLTAVAMWLSGRETAALTLHLLILPTGPHRRAAAPFLATG